MSQQILRIKQATVLKRRPLQSTQLSAEEKFSLPVGKTFELHSYAYADADGDFNAHIKFAIKNQSDFINGFSTWYVYNLHAQVEMDGQVVYPIEDQQAVQVLKVTNKTIFKRRPVQSTELPEEEKQEIPQGTVLPLHSYAYADATGSFNSHIRIALKDERDYIRGFSTWYVYDRHAQVEFDGKVLYPPPAALNKTAQPATTAPATRTSTSAITYYGQALRLPTGTTVYTDQPIIPGCSFTWGEATHGGQRIPESVAVVNNITALARQLQRAREQIGRPFHITSWYRPEPYNSWAGGALYSQHLTGRATDLYVDGFTGRQIANKLLGWWPGGVGVYSHLPYIVHLDIGSSRIWGF